MRHERPTEELREIAALYALGSLTQQEARSFENHVEEGCPICEAEQRKYERAVAAIGLSAAEAAPPEYIRDLLSARIEREPQAPPRASTVNEAVEERPVMETPRPNLPSFSMMTPPRKDRSNLFPWMIVVLLAILGLSAAYAWKSTLDLNALLQTKISAAQADLDDLRAKLDVHKISSGNLEQILSIAGKPGARLARLVLQTTPSASSAMVIWDTEKGSCLILGALPPPPEGKNYQLWFFTATAKVSAGLFKLDSADRAFETVRVPGEAANAGVAVVTLEPDNGSKIPTFPYFAIGRIN